MTVGTAGSGSCDTVVVTVVVCGNGEAEWVEEGVVVGLVPPDGFEELGAVPWDEPPRGTAECRRPATIV